MKSDFKTLVAKLELVKKTEFAMRHKRSNPIVSKTRDALLDKLRNIVGSEADVIYKRLGNEKMTSILEDFENIIEDDE